MNKEAPATPLRKMVEEMPLSPHDAWIQCSLCREWHMVASHISEAFGGEAFFSCQMLNKTCKKVR